MKFQLVDNWWIQFKNKVSIKLAAVFGLIAAALTANPAFVMSLIGVLPAGAAKYGVAVLVGALSFILPAMTALVKQPKLSEKIGEANNAESANPS